MWGLTICWAEPKNLHSQDPGDLLKFSPKPRWNRIMTLVLCCVYFFTCEVWRKSKVLYKFSWLECKDLCHRHLAQPMGPSWLLKPNSTGSQKRPTALRQNPPAVWTTVWTHLRPLPWDTKASLVAGQTLESGESLCFPNKKAGCPGLPIPAWRLSSQKKRQAGPVWFFQEKVGEKKTSPISFIFQHSIFNCSAVKSL